MSSVQAILICTVYVTVGLGLIFLNQYILKDLKFPYPMFLSGLGVLASAVFARVLVRFGHTKLSKKEEVEGILWYQRVLPVGMASAGTLAFGNMVYLLLDVGFIQMLKSFTPVVIIFFGYITAVDIPSIPVVYSVIVISVGIAATCTFSPVFHVAGITVMFLSEIAEAVRLILTQFLLKQMKFGVVEGQYVLAPASAFWLFVASAIFEFPQMYESNAILIMLENANFFLLASAMGVIVNFMAYSVIQSTNSLTMKMLGTLRSIVTIGFGVLLYHEVIPIREAEGYLLALVGFVGYNLASSGYLDSYEWLNVTPDKALRSMCASLWASASSGVGAAGHRAKSEDPEAGGLIAADDE
jgi:drug/metabolite transporter (DMT)-like permease